MTATDASVPPKLDAGIALPGPTPGAADGRRLGRNITVLAGSQVVTWSVTLVWTLVVPRLLGPAGMGRLVTAYSVAAILGVLLGLGTKTFLVREIVARPAGAASLIGTAVVLRVCVVPLFVGAIAVYTHFAKLGTEGTLVVYLATGATFFTLLAEPVQAAFQAVERMEYLAYSDMVDKTAQSVLGIGLAVLGFGAVGLTACVLVVEGVVLLLNAWWVRPHVRIDLRTDVRRMRLLVTDSIAYWAFGLFFMIYLWIDSVMLSLMVRPEVVGWYGVSTKLFTTLMFVPAILSTAWLPRLVGAFEGGGGRLRAAARAPLELVLILSLPIAVISAMTAGGVIPLIYGDSYRHAVPVMVILALCLPPMYLNIMLNQVLVAAKRQREWTWVMAGATVVNPLLNLVLIRVAQSRLDNGAIGAAASLLLTEVLIVMVGMMIVGRQLLGLSSLWRLTRAGVAATAMWVGMYAARPLGFLIYGPLGGGIFLAFAFLLRVANDEELAVIRTAARRVLRIPIHLAGRRGRPT